MQMHTFLTQTRLVCTDADYRTCINQSSTGYRIRPCQNVAVFFVSDPSWNWQPYMLPHLRECSKNISADAV